jgi:uncharacterized protein (TIGR03435 family)
MRGSGTMVEEESETTQFYAISMALLANTILPGVADRPVVDKTGLTGYYDLALPTSALERAPPSPPVTSLPLDIPSPPTWRRIDLHGAAAGGRAAAPAREGLGANVANRSRGTTVR